jgi:hypothetical protein
LDVVEGGVVRGRRGRFAGAIRRGNRKRTGAGEQFLREAVIGDTNGDGLAVLSP